MALLRKALLAFLLIVFVLLFQATILGTNSTRVLLGPEYYVSSFEDNNVYEELPGILAETISAEMGGEISGVEIDLERAINQVITPDYVRGVVNGPLENSLEYISGKTVVLDLKIKIEEEKVEEILGIVVEDAVKGLPECGLLEFPLVDGEIKCIPQGMGNEQIVNLVLQNKEAILADIPTEIDLVEESDGEIVRIFGSIKEFVGFASLLLIIFAAILVAIILLVIFVTRKQKKTMFKWVGSYLFFSGLIGLALFSMVGFVVESLFLEGIGQEIPGGFSSIITEVIGDLANFILFSSLIYFIVSFVMGLVLLLIGIFVLKKKKLIEESIPAQIVRPEKRRNRSR